MDDDEKQAEWDKLISALEAENEAHRKYEEQQRENFKVIVARILKSGVKDEATAHRWLMDASGCDGDWEYLAYKHGLPYGYFNGKV